MASVEPRTVRRSPWHWMLRLLGQDNVPHAVRPLALSAALQATATSGFATYVGVWAIQQLHAGLTALGIALFLRAGAGVVTGYLGGGLSDRIGRRPVILASWGAQTLCIGGFAFVQDNVALGLALIVAFGPLGPPGGAASAAFVADTVGADERPMAYASLRAALSLARVLGPAVAALLVIDGNWARMFAVLAAVSAVAVVVSWLLIPRGAPPAGAAGAGPDEPIGSGDGPRTLWRDRPYLLFLAGATIVMLAMAATDRFLPIAAVTAYHVPAAAWGLIAVLNPILVVLLQTRVTRATEPYAVPARLLAAGGLAGLPFLLLLVSGGPAVVAVIVALTTLGEMLWLPLAQTLAAEMAPLRQRGAYLGAFDAATSAAFAVGPMAALSLSAAAGNASVWGVFAALALLGALLVLVPRRARRVSTDAG